MTRTVKRQMLFWGWVFLFLVGAMLHVRQMFYMSAALALLGPVAYVLGRRALRDVQVTRRLSARLTAGEHCRVALELTNPSPRPKSTFRVADTLPPALRVVGPGAFVVDELAPGETRRLTYELEALRRGVFPLGPVHLAATDLLNLHDFAATVPTAGELLVYPRAVRLPDLWARGGPERPASRRPRRRLGALDPRGTRDYVPGDDLRHIHWPASAHRNHLILVDREESEGLRVCVALDLTEAAHTLGGDADTLEQGISLAASLLVQALSAGGEACLVAEGLQDYSAGPVHSPEGKWKLLEALARARPDARRGLGEVLRSRLAPRPRGTSVAVLTPQTGPEVDQASAWLASRSLRAIWFLLASPSSREQGAVDPAYERVAHALWGRGQRAYVLRSDQELEAAFAGRVSRAAV